MTECAALYARVSTPQKEQEATIASQVAALESFAQQREYRLLPQFSSKIRPSVKHNWIARRSIACAT